MKRAAAIGAMVLIAAVFLAGPGLAKGTPGKVVSIEGDRVTLQLEKGAAAAFPNGTKNIDIRSGDGVSLRGAVVAAKGDKITFRITKGKASRLAAGDDVELVKPAKAGAEEMQGC